jgi:uncharacterized repeat protein (TIGR03847 family)
MSESYDFDNVDGLVVATVGLPGNRTFLLQARQNYLMVTLKVEKQQVAALAQYLGELLSGLPRPGDLPEDQELDEPAEAEWSVGTIGITYDESIDRVLLVVEEAVPEGTEGTVARFAATREQAAALAIRGIQLVEAGRPPCPLCGYPLEPGEHACPRTNGHRPPAT